jgi:hypothetical protein
VAGGTAGTMLCVAGSNMTKAVQETTVGEGLAVGCLLQSVTAVIYSKLPVQSAFRHAWPRWEPRSRFPVVRGTVERTDIWRLLNAHDRRRGAWHATWERAGSWLVPRVRDPWDVHEAAEAIAEHSGVGVSDWIELAETFIRDLKAEQYVRG